jgi:hypothetical protein
MRTWFGPALKALYIPTGFGGIRMVLAEYRGIHFSDAKQS